MTEKEELKIKWERIRVLLQQLSLDAVYLKRQDNFAWLTAGGINYVGLGEMGNCGLLITRDTQYAITSSVEESRMRDEERLEELGYPIHAQTWYETAFEGETIRKLVPSQRVGFDHGNSAGPNLADAVKVLRFSLTASEMERYLEGGYLTARAIEETIAQVHPGDRELAVVGKLAHRIRESGLDVVSAMCAADERISNYRHPVPTDCTIHERVQLGGNMRYKGLIICCTRLMNFVPVSRALADQYLDNVGIDCLFMAASVPGKRFSTVLEEGREAYRARGYAEEFKLHHQGGPIGYAGRDYRVDFSTPGEIQENQAFCWNPSITGTKSEDTVIATTQGIVPVSRPILCPTITLDVKGQTFIRPAIWEG